MAGRPWVDAGPSRAVLAPLSLLASNTIGNVPAVVMILSLWPDLVARARCTRLALLSTLAGNLLIIGSWPISSSCSAPPTMGVKSRLCIEHAKRRRTDDAGCRWPPLCYGLIWPAACAGRGEE
jgi:hypothetical protein